MAKNFKAKIRPGNIAFRERFLVLYGATYPFLTPDRGFLGSWMASSPVTSAFMLLTWVEPFRVGRGIDDLAQHSNNPRLFTEKLSIMNWGVTQEFLGDQQAAIK